jgi:hypothetical protein
MQNQNMVILFASIGLFFLFAPDQYVAYLPVTLSTQHKQIIACVALLAAYYYYNGEKLM